MSQGRLFPWAGMSLGENVTFNQSGGILSSSYGGLGIDSGAVYNLSDGSISSDKGLNVKGVFNQTGGGVGIFSDPSTISGLYNLTGGQLYTFDIRVTEGGTFNLDKIGEIDTVVSRIEGTFNFSGGIFASNFVENNGIFNYSDGSYARSDHYGKAVFNNEGLFNLSGYGTRNVTVDVVNNATVKTTHTTAVYTGTFTNNGAYISDPATQYFEDLFIGENGYLVGQHLDNFFIRGDFINNSMMQ
jgi:hypothetical protein